MLYISAIHWGTATAIIAALASAVAAGLPYIKEWLGFKKDVIETKKSAIELNKLAREEKEAANRIKPATMEDVYRFDPTYAKVRARTRDSGPAPCGTPPPARLSVLPILFLFLLLLAGLTVFGYYIFLHFRHH